MTAVLVALALFVAGEDTLAAARDLYASAAYEEALAVLNRLPQSNQSGDETRAVEQYRALCLLALGRTSEAQRAIEAVVAGDPWYRLAADVSPRVRTAFSDVRRRMLPVIVQQQYTAAKGAYDRKEFPAAIASFNRMLEMMTDPDVEAVASQPPLSDLRTVAAGFRDLAMTAIAPPPPPPAPAPAPEPVAAVPPAPAVPRVYGADDGNVVPPQPIRQDLPPFPGSLMASRQGMIDVLIDETGAVESAVMTRSVTRQYDSLALSAARGWRYRPATLNGAPVKYRKAVAVFIKPQQPNRE
jgi:tetratricopeptide (TPR) repeat protein